MPFVTLTLVIILMLGVTFGVPIVLWIWPGSVARQAIVISILIALLGLLLVKEKLSTGILLFLFSTQFSVSLYTVELAQPALLQFYLMDGIICLLFIIAIEKRVGIKPDSAGWIMILFLFWCCLVTLNSAHKSKSVIYNIWLLKYVFVYLFFLYVPISEKLVKYLYMTCAAILLFQSLLGFAQILHGGAIGLHFLGELQDKADSPWNQAVRVAGTFGANGFAGYLSMLLIVTICGAITSRSLFLYVSSGMGAISLLTSFSRAGWLSFSIGMLMLFSILVRKKIVSVLKFFGIILVGSLFFTILIALNLDRVVDRFTGRQSISAIQSRIVTYEQGIETASKYPLFGIGPGVTEFFGAWTDNDKFLKPNLPNVKMGNQVHNGFLQVMIETGAFGLFLWLLILTTCIRPIIFSGRNKSISKNKQGILIGAAVGAVVFLVHICFGTEINNYRLFLLFCFLFGLSRNRCAIN
jgi:O-antigen ligase